MKKIKIKNRSAAALIAILHCKGGAIKSKRERRNLENKQKLIKESIINS